MAGKKSNAWAPFPLDNSAFIYDAKSLKANWARLHIGDAEPFPKDAALQQAWIAFHAGEFQKACEAGVALGPSGYSVANKAQCIYANYLETDEARKLAMFEEAAARAEAHQAAEPDNPNAWYWQAYALGRYSQGISVVKALSQGIGTKVKSALEKTLALQPKHADAHIALGAFHAEVIDKVGSLLAKAQGASKSEGLAMFKEALRLNPGSAIARTEYATGLVMLEGEKKMAEAEKLYQEAAACEPMDAMEALDIQAAKEELED
jgi:tetratricopeptide (TPR) repeat protein